MEWTSVLNAISMTHTIRVLNGELYLGSYKSILMRERTVLVAWWEEEPHSIGLKCDWLLKTLKESIKLSQNSSGNEKREGRAFKI